MCVGRVVSDIIPFPAQKPNPDRLTFGPTRYWLSYTTQPQNLIITFYIIHNNLYLWWLKLYSQSVNKNLCLAPCIVQGLPSGENSGQTDLFTRHWKLRTLYFHHLLSTQTKQGMLSYQFGSGMWIYIGTLVNFATLCERETSCVSKVSLTERAGNMEAMSDLFQLWGSITRVDTILGAEMTAENETGSMT